MAIILIIEPDHVLAHTYQAALKQAGHEAHFANSAQQAIDAADTHKPDVILLELQLAAHNGVEFLYEFRSYPEWQAIPIIIHSNVPPKEFGASQATWQQLGVMCYMYKPRTTLVQLVRSVNELIPKAA